MSLDLLPYDCFAHILSFTSPSDVCRLSVVSSTVHQVADSDNAWEKFLPADYREILSRLVVPLVCLSKKELFLKLCSPLLIDHGTKTFSLEKSTSKKIYMLSARELSITWASNPLYWTWKPFLHSRFAEVAELRTISWLEINGKINTKKLSPKTHYTAYLIVKFADRAFGLDSLPSEVSLEVTGNKKKKKKNGFKSQGIVYLRWRESMKRSIFLEPLFFGHRMEALRSLSSSPSSFALSSLSLSLSSSSSSSRVVDGGGAERIATEREDGWIEVELGSFYNNNNNDNDEEVKMCLKEVKGQHLKGGLIVEGIELRPKS